MVKNLPASGEDERDVGLTPGMGRSPGGRHGNTLQYSCLETPMDRGAWWATVQGGYKEEDMNWTAKHMATPGPSPHLLATRAFPHGPSVPKDQLYLGFHNQIPQNDWLRKGRGARDQITNICWVIKKAREFQKNICFIDCTKLLTGWITIKCGKFWNRWEYQTTWPATWKICMQVKKQQLELDEEQQTVSK